MASVYDSERLAAAYARDRPPIHEQILGAARLGRRADRALDIGCGAGLSTAALAPLARLAIGLEPVSTMLTHRRTVASHASFVTGRAERLPFAAGSFDLVTAAGSLNYADLPSALAEIARVLTRDGTFLLYDFSTGRRSVSGDELADWFDSFERRYPWPPGWTPLDVREMPPAAHGLRLIDYTDLEIGLPLDLDAYLRYMLSEVNVDDAIARGACTAEQARDWCLETLKPVFADGELTVVIPGYIATLAFGDGGRLGPVESGDRVGIQGQLGRRQDLVELSDCAGAGDRNDRRLRLGEEPGEHDLTRRGAKFAGHLCEHGEPFQAARVGVGGGQRPVGPRVRPAELRRVGEEGQILGYGVIEQFLRDRVQLPGLQDWLQVGVALLHAGVGRTVIGAGDGPGALDAPGGGVARAEESRLARLGEGGHGPHRLFQGRRPVVDVRVEQVKPVHAEVTQACLGVFADGRGAEALPMPRVGITGHRRAGTDLRRDHHPARHAPGAEPAADDPLTLPGVTVPLPVVVGGVKEGPAGLGEPVQDRERRGLVGLVAEVHRSEADLADRE